MALTARGRIMGTEPITGYHITNAPGNAINGARIVSYDADRGVLYVRVDDTRIPEFWMEIEIPMTQVAKWVAEEDGPPALIDSPRYQ